MHTDFNVSQSVDRHHVNDLPQTHGIYYFLNQRQELIYVGKSVNIRQRVKSHFAAAKRIEKERKLSLHTHTIRWQETAGELSALLLESHEIKRLQPLYNRRLRRKFEQFAWQINSVNGVFRPALVKALWPPQLDTDQQPQFGAYNNVNHARKALLGAIKRNRLCAKMLGLESSGKSCFAYQLKQCAGACVGTETIDSHNARTLKALRSAAITDWPFTGIVGVVENASPDDINIFDSWYYLGTHNKNTIIELIERPLDEDVFESALSEFTQSQTAYELDRDSYKILLNFVTHKRDDITLIDYSMV